MCRLVRKSGSVSGLRWVFPVWTTYRLRSGRTSDAKFKKLVDTSTRSVGAVAATESSLSKRLGLASRLAGFTGYLVLMAMSLALAGLRIPGVQILDPSCVAKTFPGYWRRLAAIAQLHVPDWPLDSIEHFV